MAFDVGVRILLLLHWVCLTTSTSVSNPIQVTLNQSVGQESQAKVVSSDHFTRDTDVYSDRYYKFFQFDDEKFLPLPDECSYIAVANDHKNTNTSLTQITLDVNFPSIIYLDFYNAGTRKKLPGWIHEDKWTLFDKPGFLPSRRWKASKEPGSSVYGPGYVYAHAFKAGKIELKGNGGNGQGTYLPYICRQDICTLPQKRGRCGASLERWYFDGDACKKFIFGGCDGNENNFENKKQCESRCVQQNPAATTESQPEDTEKKCQIVMSQQCDRFSYQSIKTYEYSPDTYSEIGEEIEEEKLKMFDTVTITGHESCRAIFFSTRGQSVSLGRQMTDFCHQYVWLFLNVGKIFVGGQTVQGFYALNKGASACPKGDDISSAEECELAMRNWFHSTHPTALSFFLDIGRNNDLSAHCSLQTWGNNQYIFSYDNSEEPSDNIRSDLQPVCVRRNEAKITLFTAAEGKKIDMGREPCPA